MAVLLVALITLVVAPTLELKPTPDEPTASFPKVRRLATGMGFTEGPVWLPKEEKLVFSDIPGSKLMQWSASNGLSVYRASKNANGNALDLDGRLLSCQHGARNIVRINADGSTTVIVDRYEGKRLNSPNDVAVKSDGSLWFTDPPWGLKRQTDEKELPGHWVFRFDPKTDRATVLIRDLAMPNGIALSPDETRLYVSDTGGHRSHPMLRDRPPTVTAYVINKDNTLAAEPAWRIRTRSDGMCVDVDGKIYTTGPKGVNVWNSDGTPVRLIPVEESPANVCFGGKEFKTLFITARTSLYAVELDTAGSQPKRAAAQPEAKSQAR